MFKKLKLKFILTNVLTSTAVIVIAFASVYLVAANSAGRRMIEPLSISASRVLRAIGNVNQRPEQRIDQAPNEEAQSIEEDMNQEIKDRIAAEREASLGVLLLSLIIIGAAMEAVIVIISIYLAEQSIQPVKEAYEAQKAFVANASHEIKTPLAVIQANLEAADIKNNKWIENAEKKVDELTSLNNQLLSLARMDVVEDMTSEKQTENITALTKETIDFYTSQIKNKQIHLETKIDKNQKLRINRESYLQILNILIDNAVKYSKKSISIKLHQHTLTIANDGATISKSDIKHIFDRFYQTDKTKSGVGLGLAIAKQVADKNSWEIKAKSDSSTTTFILELK